MFCHKEIQIQIQSPRQEFEESPQIYFSVAKCGFFSRKKGGGKSVGKSVEKVWNKCGKSVEKCGKETCEKVNSVQ